MRIRYKDSSRKFYISLVIRLLIIALLVLAFVFASKFSTTMMYESAANNYCRNIFPYVSFIGNSISNFFFFSISENLVIVIVFVAIFVIVRLFMTLIRIIRCGIRRKDIRRWTKVITVLLVIAVFEMCVYQLMHGINYYRTPVEREFNLESDTSFDMYENALSWSYMGMVTARAELGEDYRGVAHMNTNLEEMAYDANSIIDAVSDEYDLGLSKNYIRVKGVSLSHLWSYTDILGVYSVLLGESNVNTDYMDIQTFPVTLCHEICHAKGYAREYDCEMIAVIACIESVRADFRYAGFYYIFTHLYNDVVAYAESENKILFNYFGDPMVAGVIRDYEAQKCYQNTLKEGFIPDLIAKFSEDANNQFLESNGQEGGTATYRVHPDFFVNFYFTYVWSIANG